MAPQITGVPIVCSTVCSGADQRKTSKLRVTGLCEGKPPMTGGSPHKGPVTRKLFPFDHVIMIKTRNVCIMYTSRIKSFVVITSDYGLPPTQCQSIPQISSALLPFLPPGTHFREIWTKTKVSFNNVMMSSNINISALQVLCEGNPPVSSQKVSDAELWFYLWSAPEQTVEQTIETSVIWDAVALNMTSL